MRPHAFDAAFDLAARQVESGVVPFVVLGIAGAERVERLEAYGSTPDGGRIGTNASCLLASVTKPIVATCVVRLAQEGRFPLTAPLSRWLPELEAAGLAPFTAWHVLTHTSGLGDIDLVELVVRGATRDEVVRRTIERGQEAPPGSRFAYASFPWDVLALAVERAVGRRLETVLRETVLDPLGMSDTTFDHARSGSRRAPVELGGWDATAGDVQREVATDEIVAAFSAMTLAGAGLWSSAPDVLRFGRAMLRGGELDGARVLGRPFVQLMTREVTVDGLGDTGDRFTHEHYGMGWGMPGPASPGSRLAFQHGGISGTRLLVDPGHDLVLVYLTGRWGAASEAIDDVVAAAYGAIA
jgi:CubicO group peptidase (beta-lactamase class C family)